MQSVSFDFVAGNYVCHKFEIVKVVYLIVSIFQHPNGKTMLRLEGYDEADSFYRVLSPQEERFTLDAISY